MDDKDLIRRGDALAAVQVGETVTKMQSRILAIPSVDADPVCTDCGGTGITYQTERRCACQPAPQRLKGKPMTDLVARARAALDGVTSGEWFCDDYEEDDGAMTWCVHTKEDEPVVSAVCGIRHRPDARFIAAASSLVPDMADLIEALEAEIEERKWKIRELEMALQEAERTAWERGRDAAAVAAYRTCASTRHVSLGVNCEAAILALTPETSHD